MMQNNAPTTTHAATALWPIGLATALSLMGDATLYAVLPTHSADAGIALAGVGIVLSINRFIRLVTNSPAGWLIDRLPDRRALFISSLTLGVVATTIYAASTGLPTLLFGRLLWGLAWSGIWIGGNAIVLQMAPKAQRGHWVGIYQVWFFLGSSLGSFLGGMMTDAVGYREALWIGAGISAVGALAAFALPSESQPIDRARLTLAPVGVSFLQSIRDISPAMWATATAQGVNRLAAAGIVSATLGLVVQESLGTQLHLGAWQIGVASVTGGLLGSRTLISLVGAPLAGKWSDDAGQRWGLLAASLLLGAFGIGVLAAPNLLIVIAGTVAGAIASGSVQALTTALAGDLSSGNAHGKNLGFFNTAGDFGSAIGPLFAYALLPITGLGAIYIGCAILMLGVAAWVTRFRQPQPARFLGRSEP
jgi:DHA1 family multidrug resistance protein-like MFS transporter